MHCFEYIQLLLRRDFGRDFETHLLTVNGDILCSYYPCNEVFVEMSAVAAIFVCSLPNGADLYSFTLSILSRHLYSSIGGCILTSNNGAECQREAGKLQGSLITYLP